MEHYIKTAYKGTSLDDLKHKANCPLDWLELCLPNERPIIAWCPGHCVVGPDGVSNCLFSIHVQVHDDFVTCSGSLIFGERKKPKDFGTMPGHSKRTHPLNRVEPPSGWQQPSGKLGTIASIFALVLFRSRCHAKSTIAARAII